MSKLVGSECRPKEAGELSNGPCERGETSLTFFGFYKQVEHDAIRSCGSNFMMYRICKKSKMLVRENIVVSGCSSQYNCIGAII